MIQHLTESWAGAYLQVAATILVFALSIPYVVEQISVPDDLRSIIRRYRNPTRWLGLFLLLATLVTLCFIWWLHPTESGWINNLTASILMTLIVVTPFLLLWLLRASYRKDRILDHLNRKCNRRIRREGRPDEVVVDDILFLGERGKTPSERVRVLKVLESIAREVQSNKQYVGSGLEDIVRTIELILQKDENVYSFTEGIMILARILENTPRNQSHSSPDAGSVLRTLARLGGIASTMTNERPARKIMEAVAAASVQSMSVFSEASLAFLEIGRVALDKGYFLVAAEALNKLETMTWARQPLDGKSGTAYLGLVAHFWCNGGSARRRAMISLKGVKFISSRRRCLKEAQEIHFKAARWDTAEALAAMTA